MSSIKRLASHFGEYWKVKGESMDVNLAIPRPQRTAAEEVKAPMPPAKPPIPPKAPEKAKEDTDVIGESVNNLDDLVEKEIDRKFLVNIKRIIEDAIRKTLGRTFQDMEKALRPKIEKEVAEQSKDVERDIREVVPTKAVEKEVLEKKEEPVAPPLPPAPKAASLEVSAESVVRDLPKEITLSDGTVVQPIGGQKAKLIKDGKDLGIEVGINPDLKEEDQIKLYETKLLELRKATEELEKMKEPTPVVPAVPPVEQSEIKLPEEGAKEVSSMFKVTYHEGNTIESSYFVGSDGANVKVVSAARVIPADVQEKIRKATEEKKAPEDIIEPEEAEKQLAESVGNTMEGFTEWANQLPKITRSASLEKKGEWAINESEIPKVDMPKKDAGPFTSVDQAEAAEGKKLEELPKGEKSQVKKYYGRLPGEGGGEMTTSINLQSTMSQKYQLMKKALEEKEEELKTTKDELGKKDKEIGDMKAKDGIDKAKGKVDQLLAELKKVKPIAPDKEKNVLDILAKIDATALGQLIEVVKLISGKEDKVGGPDLFGGPKPMGGPAMPPLPPKPASQTVVTGTDLPPVYPASNSDYSLTEIVSNILDHN